MAGRGVTRQQLGAYLGAALPAEVTFLEQTLDTVQRAAWALGPSRYRTYHSGSGSPQARAPSGRPEGAALSVALDYRAHVRVAWAFPPGGAL
jgi:hypothetical protein